MTLPHALALILLLALFLTWALSLVCSHTRTIRAALWLCSVAAAFWLGWCVR